MVKCVLLACVGLRKKISPFFTRNESYWLLDDQNQEHFVKKEKNRFVRVSKATGYNISTLNPICKILEPI
jgi:hypothetical protein